MPRPKGSTNKEGGKPKKDKDAPKRGKSSFFYFVDAKREDVKAKNPDLKQPGIISEVSKIWATLSDSEKRPYEELANKDKERYQKQKEAYGAKKKGSDDEEDQKKTSKRKPAKKAAGEPKKEKKTKTVILLSKC